MGVSLRQTKGLFLTLLPDDSSGLVADTDLLVAVLDHPGLGLGLRRLNLRGLSEKAIKLGS